MEQAKQFADIKQLFAPQAEQIHRLRGTSAKTRREKLRRVLRYINDAGHQERLYQAMQADLRKSPTEVMATEIGPVLMSLKHILRHLSAWMRTDYVRTPLAMAGLSGRVQYQSKGNCLIFSPWNYPFQLAINPLLYAIAAGNPVILKPSEVSPHTSAFVADMVTALFDRSEVAVVPGEVEVATSLLELPFHHIFFTGSPAVGKIVMGAAARHLTSVTLELGGKSPAIVDRSVRVSKAATQTAWAKCLNAGQTCIAPDYLILQESMLSGFLTAYQAALQQFYGPDGTGISASPDYGRIINARHFARLQQLLDDALAKGAKVAIGGTPDPEQLYFPPTVLTGVNESMDMLQEEIFGPLLPVVTFSDIQEVPDILARRPPPLAFYILSKKKKQIDYLLQHSSSGGVVINDYMLSSLNPYLPFGGVNHSGIGKSNGWHSFMEFSNLRGITERKWGTLRFVYPPFTAAKSRLLKFLYKHF